MLVWFVRMLHFERFGPSSYDKMNEKKDLDGSDLAMV